MVLASLTAPCARGEERVARPKDWLTNTRHHFSFTTTADIFFLANDATLTGGYNVAWNPPDLWHLGKDISVSNSKIKLNRNQMMKNSSFLPAMVQRKKLLPQNHTTCHGPFSGAIDTWISVASEPILQDHYSPTCYPKQKYIGQSFFPS